MPSNKVKFFIEKLLPEEQYGEINISVNKKDQKVYITFPQNLVDTMLIQLMSKLKCLPGVYVPPDKIMKTPFFAYTTAGNAIRSEAEKRGAPSVDAYQFQAVYDNLQSGCAVLLTANQIDQLCKIMELKYGYKDFVWVMDVVGDNVNPNISQTHFKLEDKEEFPCKTPEQFVKAFRAKAEGELFSMFKSSIGDRIKKELPVVNIEAIKKEIESNPNSETAEVYRKLSSGF